MLAGTMSPLIDSFWRAAGYCLMPRVIALSLLPLVLIGVVTAAGGYFFWAAAVAWMQALLDGTAWLGTVWGWLAHVGVSDVPAVLAPLLVLLLTLPVVVFVCVLAVSALMVPAIVDLVAKRRFAQMQRRHGAGVLASIWWSASSTIVALAVLVLSVPLWLIPPLVLILPPLIWGWLTYRVMAFDALAEHASSEERKTIFARQRASLLVIGVLCGLLGAAPAVVWASGVVFAAAFFVLIPVAIWIYTLVFAFSSLWFTHYCLQALQRLRSLQPPVPAGAVLGGPVVDVAARPIAPAQQP
ncbi:EI24 domain-containing protein [Comamonas sp. NLF-1-9]|nr:EI24 domain-containing protein [Comamonas sp. NLF-1-9]QXL85608.1 EI24 domain-containing protein [Comamonas sp. NLF-1-9]